MPQIETIRISAAILRDSEGRIAVVRKRGTDAFMQPGGKLEPGEAPDFCITRELAEELKLTVAAQSLRWLGRVTACAANEPGAIVDASLFLVEGVFDPQPAAEIAELRWIQPNPDQDIRLAPLTKLHVMPLVAELKHGDPFT